MLYEAWLQVAAEFNHELALMDASTGARWTFGELASMQRTDRRSAPGLVFPRTDGPDFIFEVLRAWRRGEVVCPLEPAQKRPRLSRRPPKRIVHLKFTSATTGSPRLVAFTAEQLAQDARNILEAMGLRRDWPNLGVISLAHSYGFSNLVLPLLLHGIPLILVRAALPEALRRAAVLFAGVTLPAVPALWRAWHQAHAIPSNIRLAISAGAPLPLSLEREVYDSTGLKIHNFYGSTECGGIAFDATSTPRPDAACVGSPLPQVRVNVAKGGCIVVRGRAVGETYWPTPDPNLCDGVFHTRDLAEIRGNRVFLRGRACDLINVAGRKVAPEVIERALVAHPGVSECLAFGIPALDAHRGELIVACIHGQPGLTAGQIREFAAHRLPAWQVPRDWWFVESLTANGRGKLSRAEWRRRYLKQNPASKP